MINDNEYGNRIMGDEEIALLSNVVNSRHLFRFSSNHNYGQILEQNIALYTKSPGAVSIMNGTVGLRIALRALNVRRGDYVLVGAYTFIATASAVVSVGAIPVPVDFDSNTNLDCNHIARLIDLYSPKAIIAIHWPGICFNLEEVVKLAIVNKIPLIEDACQSFGANYDGRFAGLWGDIGVFSFQQNKQISSGEGGCIVSANLELLDICRKIIDHGAVRNNENMPIWEEWSDTFGENYRMTELQACVLIPQISKLDTLIESQRFQKKEIVQFLNLNGIQEFIDNPFSNSMIITLLCKSNECRSNAILFASENNILLKPIWSKPFYGYPAFSKFRNFNENCKNAEYISNNLVAIPIPPFMNIEAIERISYFLLSAKNYFHEQAFEN